MFKRMATILLTVLMLLLCACGEAAQNTHIAENTVTYKRTLTDKLSIELLRPETTVESAPCVLVFHGGGWISGAKDQFYLEFEPLCSMLRDGGFTVIGVDYRLAIDGRSWEDCLDDCMDAISFVKKNARRLGIDSRKIGVIGYSAGAHLALMSAIKTQDIALCVSLSGPTNLTVQNDSPFYSDALAYYLGQAFDTKKLSNASPTAQLTGKTKTAFLMVSGKEDPVILPTHSESFAKEAASLRVDAETMLVDGLTHSYDSFADIQTLSADITAWIRTHFENEEIPQE